MNLKDIKGIKSVLVGIVFIAIGLFVLIPDIKAISVVVLLVAGAWFIINGTNNKNKDKDKE